MSRYDISVDDVAARWRPLLASENDVDEPTLAALFIDDAEDYLDMQFPDLEAAWAPGTRLARVVLATVCEMVKRVLRNPDMMRQQSVEDVQQTFGGPEYDGRLYLTSDEFALVGGALGEALGGAGSTAGAFSIYKLPYRRSAWVRTHTPR